MIQKINYRDQVRKWLLNTMFEGKLKPKDSLSLAALARELDVSVTPIREALSQLEYSKIIESVPNRGFRIPPLANQEALHLYRLIATLEELAISNSAYQKKTIHKLEKINDAFMSATSALERINYDMQFHHVLVSHYPDAYTQQIIADIKTRIFFYELAFMKDTNFSDESNQQHQTIIKLLTQDATLEAAKEAKANWLIVVPFIHSLED